MDRWGKSYIETNKTIRFSQLSGLGHKSPKFFISASLCTIEKWITFFTNRKKQIFLYNKERENKNENEDL